MREISLSGSSIAEQGTLDGREGTYLRIRVQTRSSKKGPLAVLDGGAAELKWGIAAAPVEGQANSELLRQLADFFGLSRSDVVLSRGAKSRSKRVFLAKMRPEDIEKKLEKCAGSS